MASKKTAVCMQQWATEEKLWKWQPDLLRWILETWTLKRVNCQ